MDSTVALQAFESHLSLTICPVCWSAVLYILSHCSKEGNKEVQTMSLVQKTQILLVTFTKFDIAVRKDPFPSLLL